MTSDVHVRGKRWFDILTPKWHAARLLLIIILGTRLQDLRTEVVPLPPGKIDSTPTTKGWENTTTTETPLFHQFTGFTPDDNLRNKASLPN